MDIVETCLDVQEPTGDFEHGPLQGSYLVEEGEGSSVHAKPGQRSSLDGV